MESIKLALFRIFVLITLVVSIGSSILEERDTFHPEKTFVKAKNFTSQACFTELKNIDAEDGDENDEVRSIGTIPSLSHNFYSTPSQSILQRQSQEKVTRQTYISYRQLLL